MSNTLFIGKVLLEYQRLDSTNSQAERFLKEQKLAEGTVISTQEQYAGRGQMGNTWFHDKGKNIALSIVLYPKLNAQQQFLLNEVVALGIRDCVAHFLSQKIHIKWPNDILVEDRKICGVLIQNALAGQRISHSIVGIGINVNQKQFPAGMGNPTSMFLECEKKYDLSVISQRLFKSIETYYLQLKAGKFSAIQEAYHEFLYQKDEWHHYQDTQGNVFQACIRNVSKSGRIYMETQNGMRSFMFKEVSKV